MSTQANSKSTSLFRLAWKADLDCNKSKIFSKESHSSGHWDKKTSLNSQHTTNKERKRRRVYRIGQRENSNDRSWCCLSACDFRVDIHIWRSHSPLMTKAAHSSRHPFKGRPISVNDYSSGTAILRLFLRLLLAPVWEDTQGMLFAVCDDAFQPFVATRSSHIIATCFQQFYAYSSPSSALIPCP